MPIVTFKPARRLGSRIILTGYGMSGCGKTHSLLLIGRGLVGPNGRLGMIDTENGRGRIFADAVPGGYEYGELTAPYSPERYIEAIDDAEAAGIEALVLDSGSHEWDAVGGVLDLAEDQPSNMKRGMIKWAMPKAQHKKYVKRLLASKMHLLISLRAKEQLVQLPRKIATPNGIIEEPIPKGMNSGDIVSAGFVPIQDKNFIYETTIQLFFPSGGTPGTPLLRWPEFKCPGDLKGAFQAGRQVGAGTGEMIAEWVAGGVPVDKEYEALRTAGHDAAGRGTEAYSKWFQSIGRDGRKRVADEHENMKSIAAEADQSLRRMTNGVVAEATAGADGTALAIANVASLDTEADIDAYLAELPLDMPHEQWLAVSAAADQRRLQIADSASGSST